MTVYWLLTLSTPPLKDSQEILKNHNTHLQFKSIFQEED